MNHKQERFVEEYLIDCNATQAAIRAGYSPKTADEYGRQLLGKTGVREAIQKGLAEKSNRCQVDAEWVVKNLKTVAERCMQTEPVVDATGEPTGEYRFDSRGAARALELIGKHIGMFRDKLEVTGKDGGPIQAESVQMSDEERVELINRLVLSVKARLAA
ncbi:MAG: terminase small subunit [Gemmatales bacterium]